MGCLKFAWTVVAAAAFLAENAHATTLHALSLVDTIELAERYSPDMKAAEEGEREASERIRIGESYYYPTLDFTAVDSTGFAASAAAPPGFDGLMDSPYRVGWAAGAFSRLTLFDLTREYGVRAAKSGLRAARGGTEVTRLEVDLTAMNLFMDAVLDQRQRDVWKAIQSEVDRIYGVVKKFVRNGQYSEVTQWLLKDQSELSIQKQEVFEQGYLAAIRRLEILTGSPDGSILSTGVEGSVESLEAILARLSHNIPVESPLIASPRLSAQTSHEFASQQAAQNYPRLLGVASAGAMDDSRLVSTQNYSAWIGITFPVFEGFRISAEAEQARAEAARKDDFVDQARVKLADSETRYLEEAKSREIDSKHFGVQRLYAIRAMKLAEHRLVTFVGDLADVRDSLYSYEAAESGLSAAQIELFRAKFAQFMIQGAHADTH